MEESFRQSLLATLAFADIFAQPLTAPELYRSLWRPPQQSYESFLKELEQAVRLGIVHTKHSYYVLPGQEQHIDARQAGLVFFEEKMVIAKRAAKLTRWVPFLEAMFVCNTVAASVAEKESDIDVLIVIRAGRLWLSRLLVTVLLSIFRLRRTKKAITNKICLSFYITDNALDVSAIASGDPDIYLVYWVDQLIPLYDPKQVHAELMKKNSWVKQSLPRALQPYQLPSRYRVDDTKLSSWWRRVWERLWTGAYGDLLEKQAKQAQQAKMKLNYASLRQSPDSRVVISDTMLKFHENDRRAYYRELWQTKCKELSLKLEVKI